MEEGSLLTDCWFKTLMKSDKELSEATDCSAVDSWENRTPLSAYGRMPDTSIFGLIPL